MREIRKKEVRRYNAENLLTPAFSSENTTEIVTLPIQCRSEKD
jgi:hypothetical protein